MNDVTTLKMAMKAAMKNYKAAYAAVDDALFVAHDVETDEAWEEVDRLKERAALLWDRYEDLEARMWSAHWDQYEQNQP